MLNTECLRDLGARVITKGAVILATGGTAAGGVALAGGDPVVGAVVGGGLTSVVILSYDIWKSGPHEDIGKALRIKQEDQSKHQIQP